MDANQGIGRAATSGTFEPISVRIATAVRMTGISRSRIYELIQAGDLETRKIGRSTLVLFSSLKDLVERGQAPN
jgi:excisionase family DNA binding protein